MQARCDTLVNNMSEAFNSVIVDAKSKPLSQCWKRLDYIL